MPLAAKVQVLNGRRGDCDCEEDQGSECYNDETISRILVGDVHDDEYPEKNY